MNNARKTITRSTPPLIIAALALSLCGGSIGCQTHYSDTIGLDDGFKPEDEMRPVRQFARAQAAGGARADSMLFPAHFDGDALNSLGQERLDLILRAADHGLPLVLYLSVPEDDRLRAREMSVAVYLKDRGLVDSQMRFEVGPNPYATSPVAPNLIRLSKTEDVSSVGGTGPVDPQNAPAGSTAAGAGK